MNRIVTMLNTFSSVIPYFKFNPSNVIIDNFVFKLHYRYTFIVLIVATILVTSRQYIGEHIKCISDSIPAHVINTFCFFTTTFTVVRHLNNTALDAGAIFQPGIGPFDSQEEPIKRHAYYQWVPFVLFGQALCFYVPHVLWKTWEGGRIKALVFDLKVVGLTRFLKCQSLEKAKLNLPSLKQAESRVRDIRRTMVDRMRINRSWGAHLVLAEALNLMNVVLQIHLTNRFLGGAFYSLGPKVWQERWRDQMDALDVVFPKVTKCHFHKFGPSGSLQIHDTLCVMALNIVNEKIYTILWFWYGFVLTATSLGIIWRIFTLFMFKNKHFSFYAFSYAKPSKFDRHELEAVVKKCNFSNWMFLFFLASNLSEFLFGKVIYQLSDEFTACPLMENEMNAALVGEREDDDPSHHYPTLPLDSVDSAKRVRESPQTSKASYVLEKEKIK